MAINFRKRIRLGNLINLNVNKGGVGLSVGVPGARISLNSKGQSRATFSLPGTGLSYTKSLSLKHKTKALTKGQQDPREALATYQATLYALTHLQCQVREPIDFNQDPITIESQEIGPKQKKAITAYTNYKPSFWDKLFKRQDKKLARLEKAIDLAKNQDKAQASPITIRGDQRKNLLALDPQAIKQVMDQAQAFHILKDDVVDIKSKLITPVDQVDKLHLDITVSFNEAVFDRHYELLDSGRLSNRKLSQADFNQRSYAYLASVILAFGQESFAVTPLDQMTLNVYQKEIDKASGLENKVVIASGEINRSDLEGVNMETVNPMDLLDQLAIRIDFAKTRGFNPVTPLNP